MKITFERNGGFAGIPLRVNIDTETLDEKERIQLEKMISEIDFEKTADNPKEVKQRPDQFNYRLKVGKGREKNKGTNT